MTTKRVRGRTEESSTAYTSDVHHRRRGLPARAQAARCTRTRRSHASPLAASRFIVDVRPIASVPVRCVQVDNADHLYLAGRSMIPTHNSTLGLDIARSASIKHRLTGGASSRWR